MGDSLYLGKLFDPADEGLGERFLVDPADLTTHGIVIGMTGSGKTGLSVCLIEEALRELIPVIVIDPKGDMGNLALTFPNLAADEFEPWIDRDEAAREGRTPGEAAESAASLWTKGLADWGLGAADVAASAAGRRVRVFTPGSTSGTPLNLIASLAAPDGDFEANEEDSRDEINGVVTSLLSFVGIEADPVISREYILLFNLIERSWRGGEDQSLETLIGQVANPPIEKVGALPLEAFYPQKDRNALMFALNNLLASPAFEVWREGEPIDIEGWVRGPGGLPQLTIVYTAHLDDRQRMAVTAQVLNRLKSWMRRQPGTSELRCLFYMDEIFGYFPPTAEPPSKRPLLTLLKQARAYGVGVLLSTQNPVDIDYKGLANMGFWAVGRLQTTQDQERVREGIEAALADTGGLDFDALMSGVRKRVFLIHDIHRPAPALVHSRWAMSYLRGPITRDEIRSLPGVDFGTPAITPSVRTPTAPDREPPAALPPSASAAAAPMLPAGLEARYLARQGDTTARPHVGVKVTYRLKAGTRALPEVQRFLAFPVHAAMAPGELIESEPLELAETALAAEPPPGLAYEDLPPALVKDGIRAIQRVLRDRLDDRLTTKLLYDPATKTYSEPEEDPHLFALRLGESPPVKVKQGAILDRIAKKQGELAVRQQELSGRRTEKWTDLGTSILSNVFGGRRKSMSSVASKNRMEATAARRVEAIQAELAALERELTEAGDIDVSRFESRLIKPTKSDLSVIRTELIWVY